MLDILKIFNIVTFASFFLSLLCLVYWLGCFCTIFYSMILFFKFIKGIICFISVLFIFLVFFAARLFCSFFPSFFFFIFKKLLSLWFVHVFTGCFRCMVVVYFCCLCYAFNLHNHSCSHGWCIGIVLVLWRSSNLSLSLYYLASSLHLVQTIHVWTIFSHFLFFFSITIF